MPFDVLCGFISPGNCAPWRFDKDDIWSFSPFIDQSIFRLIRRNLPTPRLFDWQIMFFTTVVGLRFVQTELARYFPHSIFSMESPNNLWVVGRDLRYLGDGHRNRTQDLQRRAHPDQTGRAGAVASARAHGSAAEPDQSSFSFQHSEFDFFSGAFRSG
jgi:hypothetical protein